MGNIFPKEVYNDKLEIDKLEIVKLEIYTKGVFDKYCFVLNKDEILEPHIGKIIYMGDTRSEVLAIIKALEYLDFIKIKPDPIFIYTCQKAIDFINNCIYERKNFQNILLLISDKNVKFFSCEKNIASEYIS